MSRRRCCLCFWLDGLDEVQKGQFSHLDHDNQNNAEDNLAFLCFDHHDEYDTRSSTAKGLKIKEVKEWRDELYKEMEYRFQLLRRPKLRLTLKKIEKTSVHADSFSAYFELHNDGDALARHPIVTFHLPEHVTAAPVGKGWIIQKSRDFFEPNGQVGIAELDDTRILPDHSIEFFGMFIPEDAYPEGSMVKLRYRIDAEGMIPIRGEVVGET